MDRRDFLFSAAVGSLAAVSMTENGGQIFAQSSANSSMKEISPMNIVVSADPFAVTLKDSVVAHLKSKGHNVTDVGSTKEKEIPYFEAVVPACRIIQEKKANRAILFCGTGMGMSIIANRFPGVIASCVESVFAAKMCRVINNANALCLGAMIWGEWMANDAVDAFLTTNLADGLPDLADFLNDATKKVEKIRP